MSNFLWALRLYPGTMLLGLLGVVSFVWLVLRMCRAGDDIVGEAQQGIRRAVRDGVLDAQSERRK